MKPFTALAIVSMVVLQSYAEANDFPNHREEKLAQ